MRRALFATTLIASFFVLAGCSDATSIDEGDDSESALSETDDLLSLCPALEDLEFTAIVDGDALVKQSYLVEGYTRDDGTVVPGRRITNPAPASALYTVRFYRDGQGKTKFNFSIGTFTGIAANIEGSAKRLSVSGTVAYARGNSTGSLVVTSRRDAWRGVVGDVSKLRFERMLCSAPYESQTLTVVAPIVTLDKTSDATESLSGAWGVPVTVNKTVKWVKKASSASLAFSVPQG